MLLLVTLLIIIMITIVLIIRRNQKQNISEDKYANVPVDELLNDPNINTTSSTSTDTGAGASEPCVPNNSELANISYDTPSGCIVEPRNGVCLFEDLELVDGCCKLITNKNSRATEIAISITTIIINFWNFMEYR